MTTTVPTAPQASSGQAAVLFDLVVRCAALDQSALATFHELTGFWVRHLVQKHTGCGADADDAMVAVYATVWHRASGFTATNRSALAWATSITFEILTAFEPEAA